MSRTTSIIKRACDNLNLSYELIDDAQMFLRVFLNKEKTKSHLFIANNLGLNDEVVGKISVDKFYSYLLLNKTISMPKTFSFVDPNADDIYEGFSKFKSNVSVVEEIAAMHKFPLIVKANSLSRGINVYKCENKQEVAEAVNNIFNKESKNYDHVLISQDYLEIKEEYRVVVYDQKIMFAYQKDNTSGVGGENRPGGANESGGEKIMSGETKVAKFVGNLSPLHWENAIARIVKDENLLADLQKFISPIYEKLSLKYAGLDIARDKNGDFQLIEINTQPGFSYFINDNGEEELIKMFEKILSDLVKTS